MSLVKEEKSWLEWVVFALSALLITVVVGYLVRDGIQDADRPPDIRITLGQAERSAHGFVVPVSVTNLGDQTAQAVELEVLSQGKDGEETATLTYDFLASGEARSGWVGFLGEPNGDLVARVVGYRGE